MFSRYILNHLTISKDRTVSSNANSWKKYLYNFHFHQIISLLQLIGLIEPDMWSRNRSDWEDNGHGNLNFTP